MELNFKRFGNGGHPLIILHGLLGSLDNWQTIAKKLGEEYQVFTVDQRNHGKSPHSQTMDYPSMAEDLYTFLQQQGIDSAHLIGHSMGAKTAMQMALMYPEKVDRLIAVDMGPKANKPGHEDIFNALNSVDLTKISKRQEAEAQLEPYIKEFGIRQFLLKNLERTPEGQYQWKMNLQAIEKAYPNILKAVNETKAFQNPTLFMKGGKSDYIDEAQFQDYKTLFPNAHLTTIPNSGHWIHAEAPEHFLTEVKKFLENE